MNATKTIADIVMPPNTNKKPMISESIDIEEFSSEMHSVGPFENNSTIAVAVSGGADSMAMALLADRWVKENGGKIIALTVDHGIRIEAKKEALQVKKWLESRNIEHHILTYGGEKPSSNIQGKARNIRYNLLTDWCKENKILHMIVAHHMEDQAETFLIRLNRGSGVDGLSSMAPVSDKNGVRLLRPLLNISKKNLIIYLKKENQKWIEDPTNQDVRFLRNNIRNLLKNQNSSANLIEQLAYTAKNMSKARIALEKETVRQMVECLGINEGGFCTLNYKKYISVSEEIALRILSSALTTISGNIYTPRFEKLENLYNAIKTGKISGRTLWGCKIFKKGNNIYICREVSAIEKTAHIDKVLLWDKRFLVKTKEKGLKISSLTMEELKNIPKVPMIPKQVLVTFPVIKDDLENIVCIPHIGFYGKKISKSKLSCEFAPAKPLAGLPFGCYSI